MTAFPSYVQMRQRVPRRVWDAVRIATVGSALALCATLVLAPDVGLFLFWGLFIPLLPLLFFLAPGIWRNLCPLAAVNQAPRRFGWTRGLTLPEPARKYGFLVAVALFLSLVPARKVLFDDSGLALSVLLLVTLTLAFVGGMAYRGKSGWCSTFCPLLPVQRIYGQTPFVVARNSHCEPCVGCTKNCYDFNPRVAQLADLHDDDPSYRAQRALFAGAFPGLVLAFYTVDAESGFGVVSMYALFGLAVFASVGSFFVVDSLLRVSTATVAVVYGAVALNLYYGFNFPRLAERITDVPSVWLAAPAQLAVLALTVVWIRRSVAKERSFLDEVVAAPAIRLGAGGRAAVAQAGEAERPEVVVLPDERRIAVEPGATLLEIVERSGLPIEAGCRMGVCGADPVGVVAGASNLSPLGHDERMTIERLGLGENARMACSARVLGPVSVSLEVEKAAATPAPVAAADADEGDPSVRRVVIIGNGIAGVSAADYARRRSPGCEIALVARERHHLYNRMAITRLIHGRSAMEGLYLLPDSWYADHNVTCWLNTRAAAIDREAGRVTLGSGDVLEYDRLILTSGSTNFVPAIEGFGAPGTFTLRDADEAMAIRSYMQEHEVRRCVIAGGGLLGLEAAYALKKAGQRVTVVARGRLLDRQLDERGAPFLQRYLEGLGIEIVAPGEVASVEANGRLRALTLADGRSLPADLFLVCAGVRSMVALAREAGLDVNRGIVVDDRLRTSDAQVFAAGDVAEHRGQTLGIWPAAVEQGRIAGINALGGDERYDATVPETMLKVTGVDLTSVGRIEPEGDDVELVFEDQAEGRYRKLVVADGRIVGAILLGYPLDAPGVTAAIKEHRDVTPLLDRLRAGDWTALRDHAPGAH